MSSGSCKTTHGTFRCERAEGHAGECKARAAAYDMPMLVAKQLQARVEKLEEENRMLRAALAESARVFENSRNPK